MDRQQHIENIIIGTLVCHFQEYWPSVRCCITQEMITDNFNRQLYSQMSKGGKIDIATLSTNLPKDDMLRLFDLIADCDFVYLKSNYNELQYLFSPKPKYTNVTFDDYVAQFIKLYFDGKAKNNRGSTKPTA